MRKTTPAPAFYECVHRIRRGFVRSRTALVNQIRGLLGEYGIIMRQGVSAVRNKLPELIADETHELSPIMRQNLTSLYETLCFLDGSDS